MKPDRVTLRADDALRGFTALRRSIEEDDRLLATHGDWEGRKSIESFRAEQFAAYERMAAALGLKPTLSAPRASA